MQLSIIILNYNVRYFLELCVLSVQAAIKNLDAEIIVVDNNSTDDSCRMIKNHFPNIKLIENKQNFGFPKGNNIGVAAANGEYICILNPDTVVAEDTFVKILKTENWNLNTGIIGCKLIDGTGNFLPESKRGVPTPFVAFTKIFGLYKISDFFGKYYAQNLNENQSGKVDILVGAFMVMTRKLYQEIGGFDEQCFMYSDDIDLSYVVLQKGFNNYYFHETSVIHYKGESTIKDGMYMKRFQDAMHFFYRKHFKISIFFSMFMKIGIILFSFFKKFQGKPKLRFEAENYILVSNNVNLQKKLENQFQKSIEITNSTQSISLKNKSEVIFDNNFLDFKTIINEIETTKSKNMTFKILPKYTDFMIGSNFSNDRGEVVKLDFTL
ncbi:MAG: glycosyltransferase family 2 protein [Flavobacterium sp.]|nr:glycosyltransferase family 2 protein [Flavobacterium sp.]